MSIDREAAKRSVHQLLQALGHDPERDPELADTPTRVVEALVEDLLCGHDVDVEALIRDGSSEVDANADRERALVVIQNIAVASMCPHHLLPASGTATVAYLPGRRLLGLGTVAQLVNAQARRLTLQETIGERVVDALMREAGARGAHCSLTLTHSCLSLRGSRQASASVTTVAARGALEGSAGATRVAAALGVRVE